jgi:hypothetical protein
VYERLRLLSAVHLLCAHCYFTNLYKQETDWLSMLVLPLYVPLGGTNRHAVRLRGECRSLREFFTCECPLLAGEKLLESLATHKSMIGTCSKNMRSSHSLNV